MSASADNSPTRVNNATYYAWGAQCETASRFIKLYSTTTAATVTKRRKFVLSRFRQCNKYWDSLWNHMDCKTQLHLLGAYYWWSYAFTDNTSQAVMQSADGTNSNHSGFFKPIPKYKPPLLLAGQRTLGRQGGTTYTTKRMTVTAQQV